MRMDALQFAKKKENARLIWIAVMDYSAMVKKRAKITNVYMECLLK
jgi:hypothetical protein